MNILTPLQAKVLTTLFNVDSIKRHFYLTGGTALSAYYLKHRISDDLDLFTHSIELNDVERILEDALKNAKISFSHQRSSSTFRRYLIEETLQLDLVRDIDFRVGSPQLIDGTMVDDIKNIAVNKVLAIYGRLDAKDYIDLYFMIKDNPKKILELISLAKNKDAGLETFQWAKVIADANSLAVLPKMLVPVELTELKKWFHELRKAVIASMNPKKP